MNKELEALKKLKDRADHDEYLFRQDTNKEKAVKFLEENNSYVSSIETALKEHEQLKQLKLLPFPQENGEEYRKYVVKRLMVLEIIKETFKVTFNDEELTIGIDDVYFLTFKDKAKYDLLKEVML